MSQGQQAVSAVAYMHDECGHVCVTPFSAIASDSHHHAENHMPSWGIVSACSEALRLLVRQQHIAH